MSRGPAHAAPPAADVDALVTGEGVALEVRSAGVVLRSAGAAIDVLVTVAGLVLAVWFTNSLFDLGLDEAAGRAVAIVWAVALLVLLPTVVETLSSGRSLGKLALGLRVVRDDGGGIVLRHALVRALVGVLEIWMTLGGLAFVVGLLNPQGKRIGDFLAGTHAQIERVPTPPSAAFAVPAGLETWAATADVGRLPAGLARRIAAFFTHVGSLTPDRRASAAQGLVAEAAAFVAPMPAAPPELALAAIAAVRRERELAALELENARLTALEPTLNARPVGFPER
ncbi:RDD family protein [Agromyces seonyuensis]|uniref:RDD family protein n=1 Tax=Agromyces seonyuensis TaxID=2662446 RepID=UPI0030149553